MRHHGPTPSYCTTPPLPPARSSCIMRNMGNTLYYGDNLDILRDHLPDESVDLIYLDPPSNSKAACNMFLKETDGRQAAAQAQAFEDTWHWYEAEPIYQAWLHDQRVNNRPVPHVLV